MIFVHLLRIVAAMLFLLGGAALAMRANIVGVAWLYGAIGGVFSTLILTGGKR